MNETFQLSSTFNELTASSVADDGAGEPCPVTFSEARQLHETL